MVGISIAISVVSLWLSISISGPLGDVDDSSRVGHVPAGSGVQTMDSGDGGGGSSGNTDRVGNIGHSVPSGVGDVGTVGGVGGGVAHTSDDTTIGQTMGNLAEGVGISLAVDSGHESTDNGKSFHVEQ